VCSSVLPCVAVCCRALLCFAVRCSVLQCVLQCVAVFVDGNYNAGYGVATVSRIDKNYRSLL